MLLTFSIVRNAPGNWRLVEALKGAAGPGYSEDVFFKKLFSLDVWKEAFPSLQRAYFMGTCLCVSTPHEARAWSGASLYTWIGNMMRNNVIEFL